MTAILLASNYTVRAVRYSRLGQSAFVHSQASIMKQVIRIDKAPFDHIQSPDVLYTANRERSLLAVGRLRPDGSYIHANATMTISLVVAVPKGVRELDVALQYDYARASRLELAPDRGIVRPYSIMYGSTTLCRHDVVKVWQLRESELFQFTRGSQVLVTGSCADPGLERIYGDIYDSSDAPHAGAAPRPGAYGPPKDGLEPPDNLRRNDTEYGLIVGGRSQMLLIPKD
jgi:hypothetical protein